MLSLRWIKLNFAYFVIVALLGLVMRGAVLGFSVLPYTHLLHTHSHIAFLGWVYPTLFVLLVNRFLEPAAVLHLRFNLQLILTHVLILAMLIAFLVQGYAFYSILFSSLFQVLNYIFVITFWRALKQSPAKRSDVYFLKVALIALALSTFGPWAVGLIKANGLGGTSYYKMAIYFYLHFQYNGWIIFSLLALFLSRMRAIPSYDEQRAYRSFLYFALALIPDYCLSLLGLFEAPWIHILAWIGTTLQLIALGYVLLLVQNSGRSIQKSFGGFWPILTVTLAGVAFILKILLQFFPLLPSFQSIAFSERGVIVAFIHLVMLGVVSSYLIAELLAGRIINPLKIRVRFGLVSFFAGFTISELLLGFQFLYSPPHFYETLAFATLCIFIGVTLLFSGFQFRKQ